MSLLRNPKRKMLYLLVTLAALVLGTTAIWLAHDGERPVPREQLEPDSVRIPLRPYPDWEPPEPAPEPDEQIEAPGDAACSVDAVWAFVEDARDQAPGCSTFPAAERLHELGCHAIEWAVLDSGCVSPSAWFAHEALHERPERSTRSDAYCERVSIEGWQHGYRYLALRDGSVACIGTDATCAPSRSCLSAGACEANERGRCVPGTNADCERAGNCESQGACSLIDGQCLADDDDDCEGSYGCKRFGKCVALGGECVVDDAGCAASRACEVDGKCAALAGACAATEDAHCESSTACSGQGRCTAEEGACIAAANSECEAAIVCEDKQKCVAFRGQCRRGSPSMCEQSLACLEDGKCAFVENRCVRGTNEACERSEACKQTGLCTAVDNRCRATSQDDCDQIQSGEHSFRDGECVPVPVEYDASRYVSDDLLPVDFDCSQTEACKEHGFGCDKEIVSACPNGRCDQKHATCVTRSNLCKSTPACAEKGTCETKSPLTFEDRQSIDEFERCLANTPSSVRHHCYRGTNLLCVRDEPGCQSSQVCDELGHCSTRSRSRLCVPTEPEHCLASAACAEQGACGMVPTSTYHTCGATKDWHCARSEACKTEGACFRYGSTCETAEVLGIEGQCEDSRRCERFGECTLMSREGTCAPTELAHCEESQICRDEGKCGIVDGRCVATESAHCKASKACAEDGRCVLRHGSCQTPERAAALDAQCADGRARAVERTCRPHNPNATPPPALREKACSEQRACEVSGNCSADGLGDICQPSTAAHCEASTDCATKGECGVAHTLGYRSPGYSYCAPTEDDHCDGSLACIEEGACGYVRQSAFGAYQSPQHWCAPTRPEHCEESVACHQDGRCAYRNGECVEG